MPRRNSNARRRSQGQGRVSPSSWKAIQPTPYSQWLDKMGFRRPEPRGFNRKSKRA